MNAVGINVSKGKKHYHYPQTWRYTCNASPEHLSYPVRNQWVNRADQKPFNIILIAFIVNPIFLFSSSLKELISVCAICPACNTAA